MTARRVPGGDLYYVHDQGVPALTWVVNHNLGKNPAVHVEDSAGRQWYPGVVHTVPGSQTVLTFNAGMSGKAHCS